MTDNPFTNPIVTADEILLEQRYDEEERPYIEKLIQGAIGFLIGADAYKPKQPLCKVAISLMVGAWLENRDASFTEYRQANMFSIGLRSIITQLQYLPNEPLKGGDTP